MDLLNNLAVGFATALSLQNLLYCFLGVTLGTLIGVLPGLGPVATLAMLLPITYTLDPTSALIMLAGIYYGSQYGGSTTAILVNLPGESASVVTKWPAKEKPAPLSVSLQSVLLLPAALQRFWLLLSHLL